MTFLSLEGWMLKKPHFISLFKITNMTRTNINYRLKVLFSICDKFNWLWSKKILKNNLINGCHKIILPLLETQTTFLHLYRKGGLGDLPPARSICTCCLYHEKINLSSFLLKKRGSGGSPPRCFDRRLGAECALCSHPLIPLHK